jgi:hypothetical protein
VVAVDFQSEGAYFVQQEHEETSSQVQILRADVPTSSMPFQVPFVVKLSAAMLLIVVICSKVVNQCHYKIYSMF